MAVFSNCFNFIGVTSKKKDYALTSLRTHFWEYTSISHTYVSEPGISITHVCPHESNDKGLYIYIVRLYGGSIQTQAEKGFVPSNIRKNIGGRK